MIAQIALLGQAVLLGSLLVTGGGALAGPDVVPTGPVHSGQVLRADGSPSRTAVLVVDASGSMGDSGIEAARRAAQVYADTVGADMRVGLVAFSDRPRVLTATTTDRAALRAGLAQLSSQGETSLYDALVLAASQAGPKGNVVLLSDGGDTASQVELDRAIAAIESGSLHADVIAFNTRESEREALERIAAAGHGKVVRAEDAAELGRAFAAAAVAVDHPAATTAAQTTNQSTVRAVAEGGARRVAPTPAWFTPWTIAGTLSAALALVVGLLAWPRAGAELERRRRREAIGVYNLFLDASGGKIPSGGGAEVSEVSAIGYITARILHLAEQTVTAGGRRRAIALRLDRAGLALLPHEWVALRSSIVVISGAAGLLLVHPRGFGLLLGAGLGWFGAGAWLRSRQSQRCRTFSEQLPDTLQAVSSSLRSGFSLQQALAAIQETATQPMAAELGRALAAARIGVVLEDELDQIAMRMRSDDWRMAVMAIRIQRSVGGNLSEVLSTTARTLRERAAVTRQVRALSAEGRLSAYVLLGLPVGVGLFLFTFRRPYVEPLWTTRAGIVMLAVGAVGIVLGSTWMFKVAEVEV